MIRTKRVYEPCEEDDGCRVLVDALWPRGLPHDKARVDLWLKEVAPSADLRQWFRHDPARWSEFKRRYFEELDANAEALTVLRSRLGRERLTLLYAARDQDFNNAVGLAEYLTVR